jgi:tetratricopeptide (TPR) repeat protein
LKIHPNYKNAWLILANVYFYSGNSQKALDTYDSALTLDPNFRDAKNNKALVLRILGREAGEKEQNLAKAMNLFRESFMLNSEDIETIRLLGLGEGMMGNHENAIKYFQMFTQKTPNEYYGYVLLSQAYQNLGDLEKAQANRQKALSIDPQAFNK